MPKLLYEFQKNNNNNNIQLLSAMIILERKFNSKFVTLQALGSDAIIGVKFTMSSTSDPTAGVFVYTMSYGTAVITEPIEPTPTPTSGTTGQPIRSELSGMPENPL